MSKDDPPKTGIGFAVHPRAKEMLAAGYAGQGMNRPDMAVDLILVAAANADVEAEMTPKDYDFFWVLNLKFKAFLARQKLGIAQSGEVF